MEIKGQAGFSLSELLVGLLLSSIIMTALIQFYLGNKRQYVLAEQILATQFDVQWVSDLLSNSIRRAGFTPCVGIDYLTVVDRQHFDKKVNALKIEDQGLQVNRMSESYSQLIRIVGSSQLIVSNDAPLNEQRPLIISDCKHAEIHQVFSIEKMGTHYLITLTKPLIYSYAASAYVGEWLEEKWFIQKDKKGKSVMYYKLFQTEELSSLIHSMQIKMQTTNHRTVLEVVMGLDNTVIHRLIVAVRGS